LLLKHSVIVTATDHSDTAVISFNKDCIAYSLCITGRLWN